MNYLSVPPAFYPRCLMPTSTHFLPVVFLYAKVSCLMLLSLPVFRDGPLENLLARVGGGGGGRAKYKKNIRARKNQMKKIHAR